jgi:hypothetical protein
MSVRMAAQVLSHSVSSANLTKLELCPDILQGIHLDTVKGTADLNFLLHSKYVHPM